jgi:hypothetical protein
MLLHLQIVVVVGGCFVIYCIWLFDQLVRWEYEHHRAQWEKDGKPKGICWRAEGRPMWEGDFAKLRVFFFWAFNTPAWAKASPCCRRWLQHFRITVLVWNAGMLSILVRVLLHGGL